jgi:glutaryl-CoA dehydrogenase
MLAWRLGKLKDAGTMTPTQVSVAKLNNVGIACEAARVSREIHGAMGITDEYPIMRHMMNLESVKTYEGTNDIHTLAIGRELTGLAAFT